MSLLTTKTSPRPRSGHKFMLGLACCSTLAACVGSGGDSSGGSGGATLSAGSGGASNNSGGSTAPAGSGGATNSGGAPVPVSTGGSGTGGSPELSGSGGSLPAGSGGATGSGGAPGLGGGGPAGGAKANGGSPAGGSSGSVGGSSSGACAGVFCDDFERATLGTNWMVDSNSTSNTVELVTTKAHSGASSAHIKYATSTMTQVAFIDTANGFPATNNSYWARVWLFMMTGLGGGHRVYIENTAGTGVSMTGVRALNTFNAGMINTNVTPPDNGGTAGMPMPQGAWTCFEWNVAAKGAMGDVHIYIGGTEVAGTAAMGKPIPTMNKQRIGYESYAGGAAGELWIDDFAIGSTRIGCN